MFPKGKRLTKGRFTGALRGARRRSSPHFSALISPYEQGYAVVVSKKTARLSVVRHKLKRRVREALRTLPIELPPSVILYPSAQVNEMRYDALQEELIKLLRDT